VQERRGVLAGNGQEREMGQLGDLEGGVGGRLGFAMERVTFELQYSRAGGAFFLAAVGLVIGVAFALPLAPELRIAFIAWAAAQACFAAAALSRVTALSVEREGQVRVRDARGDWRAGRLRPGGFVSPWLVIVRWRPEGSRLDRTVPLWPGRVDRERLRILRVILRA
jgi:toxin CptA